MSTFASIASMVRRAESHLVQDAAGVAALAVMLVVGLHLPVLV